MGQAGYGFPKAFRLLKAAEFERVFQDPKVSADKYFTILMRPNDIGHARLGLAISKRRINKATGRNRIKRLVRESFRVNRSRLPAADFIVMARSAAVNAEGKDLWKSLARHWQQWTVDSASS